LNSKDDKMIIYAWMTLTK